MTAPVALPSFCRMVVVTCASCGDLAEVSVDNPYFAKFVASHDGVWIHPVLPQQRENQ